MMFKQLALMMPIVMGGYFNYTDNLQRIEGYSGQWLDLYFPEYSKLYNITLRQSGEQIPAIIPQRQGLMMATNKTGQEGCFAVQGYLGTESYYKIKLEGVLAAAMIDSKVVVVDFKNVTVYNLTYVTHALTLEDVKAGALNDLKSLKFISSVKHGIDETQMVPSIIPVKSQPFILTRGNNTYLVSWSASFVSTDLVNWKRYDLRNSPSQHYSQCLLFEEFIVCHDSSQINTFKMGATDASLDQTLDKNTFNVDSLYIVKMVLSTGTLQSSFYVITPTGVHSITTSSNRFVYGKLVHASDSVRDFAHNNWGYVVLTALALYDYLYTSSEIILNSVTPVDQYNNLLYSGDLQIMIGQYAATLVKPNQLEAMNPGLQTFLHVQSPISIFHYASYGNLPTLVSVGPTYLAVDVLIDRTPHVRCYFEESHTSAYSASLYSGECDQKRKSGTAFKVHDVCNTTIELTVHVEQAVAYSSKEALAIGLGLGIPILIVLLALAGLFVYRRQQQSIKGLRDHHHKLRKERIVEGTASDQIIKVD